MELMSTTIQVKDWLPTLSNFVAALLGGSFAFMGAYFADKRARQREIDKETRDQEREERNLASSFLGEIEALLKIAESRFYISSLEKVIQEMEKSKQPMYFGAKVSKEYFHVYKSNVSKLGMLKQPLPAMIAVFYTQMNSIVEDFESLSKKEFEPSSVLMITKELHKLALDTQQCGFRISEDLKKFYGLALQDVSGNEE